MPDVVMHPFEELKRLRKEARGLRQENAAIARSRDAQKKERERLEKRVAVLQKEQHARDIHIKELQKEITELKSRLCLEVDKAKKYAGMIFKSSIRKPKNATDAKRGAQKGHHGSGRKNPLRIDRTVDVYLTNCGDCGTALSQTSSVDERIVEDIPQTTTLVTCYRIQRQWCSACHKEVRGIPEGTIPFCRFGIGVIVYSLFLKYRLRTPLRKITEALKSQYDITITGQGIQELLHTLKKKFTHQYNEILQEIRNAPVKHADETNHRIDGVNGWCWLFATPSAALYTIEETRGKEVPARILGHDPTGVLVRDDCPSYFALPLPQQSCWTHLLRVSHDAAVHEQASKEVRVLHAELKQMFDEIDRIVHQPFRLRIRKRYYDYYLLKIDSIIKRTYAHEDVKAIQTRITNQRENLLTAILYDHVPLTNNHAERMIRPMVIIRKISGGSRSDKGAATHAVNMSIMQTLALQGKDFFEGIKQLLTAENVRYGLGSSG